MGRRPSSACPSWQNQPGYLRIRAHEPTTVRAVVVDHMEGLAEVAVRLAWRASLVLPGLLPPEQDRPY